MAQYKEFQGARVGQNPCSYSNLKNTYGMLTPEQNVANMGCLNAPGSNLPHILSQPSANVRAGYVNSPAMSNYVVPKLCSDGPGPNYPPRYDTFTHNQPYNCGGYFNLVGAYNYANCTDCAQQFVQRPCSGNIAGNCRGNNS